MGPNLQSNMRIIITAQQKIKSVVAHPAYEYALWILILMFIGLGSFALGMRYEQKRESNRYPVRIEYNPVAVELWENYQEIKKENLSYFASKNGSVVYPIDCDKGNRIKEENKIFFQDIDAAFDLGYREASGC